MSDVMTVLARLDGDANGMVDAFSKADKAQKNMADGSEKSSRDSVGSFERMTGGIGKALGPVAGILAATFSVGAIVSFGKNAVAAASDLQEAGTAVGAVFGPATDAVNQWASGAASAFGQSTLQALDAAKTFGVYGAQAGLAADANADFSMTLTTTASDLASFHNADPSDVIAAIGSGLRGEAEPLRQFGILMNEATLNAAAMKAGISDGITPLTAQQKILAANALILDSVGVAQGDVARTSGGLANQQRIMAANFTNLSATIGSAFVPVLGEAAQFINNSIFPALTGMATAMEANVGPALDNMGGAFSSVMAVVGPIAAMFGSTLGPIFATLGPQILALVTTLSPLGIVLGALQPVLPIIAQLLGTIGSVLSGALAAVLPVVTPLVEGLANVLSGALGQALPIISTLVSALGAALLQVLPAITPLASVISGSLLVVLGTLVSAIGPIAQTLMPLFSKVLGVLAGALVSVAPVLGEVAGVVANVLSAALEAVAPLLGALVPIIGQVLGVLTPLIAPILGVVKAFLPLISVVGDLIGAILPPLVSLLMAVLSPVLALVTPLLGLLAPALSFVGDTIGMLVGWISQGISWLLNLGGNTTAVSKGVGAVIGAMGTIIGSVFSTIGNVIGGAVAVISNNFNAVMNVVNAVGGVFRSVFGAIGGFISSAFNNAVGVVRGAINGIIGLANGAIGALNGLKVTIPDWVPGVGGQSFGVSLPRVPYLATGGQVTRTGIAMVGEAGPELVKLPTGASVIPLNRAAEQLGGGSGETNVYVDVKVAHQDPYLVGTIIGQRVRYSLEAAGATA